MIFKCLWFIFCSKNFKTQCLGFERQWIGSRRVAAFSVWFWFGFWLCVFVFSRLLQCLGPTCFLAVRLLWEGRTLKDFIFSVLHRIFQGREAGGGKGGKSRGLSQWTLHQGPVIDKIRAGLRAGSQMKAFTSFGGSLHAAANTLWAFVLKMPQQNRSHKQVTRSPQSTGKWHSRVATWLH